MNRTWMMYTAAGAAMSGIAIVAHAEQGELFASMSYVRALEANRTGSKLLIVEATASWHQACKQMDKVTWSDPALVTLLRDRAVVIKVDVDQDAATAKELGVDVMPTLVAYRSGQEVGRLLGFQSADDIGEWMNTLAKAPTAQAAVKAQPAKAQPAPQANSATAAPVSPVQARLQKARTLIQNKKLDDATQEYAWLWENIPGQDAGLTNLRTSLLAAEMTQLASVHAPAKARFVQLRDGLDAPVQQGKATPEQFHDWFVLNTIVAQDERCVAWFDAHKDDSASRDRVELVSTRLQSMLASRGRWSDMGRLIDVTGFLALRDRAWDRALPAGLDEKARNSMTEASYRFVRSEVGLTFAGLLASGRDRDADRVRSWLLGKLDDAQSRRVLVRSALDAAQPRLDHLTLLDEADAKGAPTPSDAQLRQRLESALKK
jgi:thioredoxin 1